MNREKQGFVDAVAVEVMGNIVTAFGETPTDVTDDDLRAWAMLGLRAGTALWEERERRRWAEEEAERTPAEEGGPRLPE